MDIEHQHAIDDLLSLVPEFTKVHQEHREYWGDIMSYLLMARLVDFATDTIRNSGDSRINVSKPIDVIERTMRFVENSLTDGTESVQNLVALGFLENFDSTDPTYTLLRSYLGPVSRTVLKDLEDGWAQLRAKLDDAK